MKPRTRRTGIKVLRGLAPHLVQDRQVVNQYTTNRTIKAAALYFYLKSLTSSCKLQEYPQQLQQWASDFNVSARTIKAWLELARGKGFITIISRTIHLSSYESIANSFGLETRFDQISLATGKGFARSLPLVITALEIADNQRRQRHKAARKLNENPYLRDTLIDHLSLDPARLIDELQVHQEQGFRKRSNVSKLLYQVNADENRTAPAIQRAHNRVHPSSIGYLKKQLQLAGLAIVRRRVIVSVTKASYCPGRFTRFINNKRTTYMPDAISLNTSIFCGF